MARVALHRWSEVVGYAVVDDDDLPLVSEFRWSRARKEGHVYASTNVRDGDGYRQVYMHRLVLGLGPGDPDVDHRDGDGLNNARANLRVCSHAQNMQNRRDSRTRRFRGVQQLPSGRWRARYGHAAPCIGVFDTELEAAQAAEEWRRDHTPFAEPDPALVAAGG